MAEMSPCDNWENYKQTRFWNHQGDYFPTEFGIISPKNPDGIDGKVQDPLNIIPKSFKSKHIGWIDGYTDTHVERSAIFNLNRLDCIEIGNIWQQDAIFFVENDLLSLIYKTNELSIELDSFSKRFSI